MRADSVDGGSGFGQALAALFGRLWSSGADEEPDQDRGLVAELTDTIVDTVEPRVRARGDYRERLAPSVRATIAYLRELGRLPLDPVPLARASWGPDPCINAFFGRAEDIPALLGRSQELRAFFETNAMATEAFALLGMQREERTVFAPSMENGVLTQDVPQTTVNFTGHRLLSPAASLEQVREEAGKRLMLRLAQLTLARVLEADEQGAPDAQHKHLQAIRSRLLKQVRDGVGSFSEDPTVLARRIERARLDLDHAMDPKSRLATLDGSLALIEEVFGHPTKHVALERTQLHLSRMNVKVKPGSAEPHQVLQLAELRVGEQLKAVIAFVRCPRSELPARKDLLAQAERFL
ncbi:hypothetical protein GCM10028796_14370 [Ramlibacter monticola]|uniref:Uncharacterized protein n=1 Tax=Ramlibacter monticola TaxID=1926872 RepID=A0A937CQC8_9BURK|nr:hypothetical protein [Ramlibacter monticola]MBL0390270.1 hypothetical protein [Ramlibacter monticola]